MSEERPTRRPGLWAVDAVAEADDLTPGEVRLWLLYRARWNVEHPEWGVYASDETVAEWIGHGVASVERWRRGLTEKGWLHVERDKGPNRPIWRKWATMPDDVAATIPEPSADDSDSETKAWKCLRRWHWHDGALEAGRNEHGPALRWERPAHYRDEKKRWIYHPLDDEDVTLDELDFDEARRLFHPTGQAEYAGIFGYGPAYETNRTGTGLKTIE